GFLMVLCEQNKGGACDGPCILTRSIHEPEIEVFFRIKVCRGSGIFKGFEARLYELTCRVFQCRIGEIVQFCIGKFDIPDSSRGLMDIIGHPLISLAADAERPFYRSSVPNFRVPVRTCFGKIGSKYCSSPGAVGPMDNSNFSMGQVCFWIQGLKLRIIPVFDVPKV